MCSEVCFIKNSVNKKQTKGLIHSLELVTSKYSNAHQKNSPKKETILKQLNIQ